MKNLILLMFISVFISSAFAQEKGSFTDIRDGKTYKTVKIGDQVWMAENLNYFVNGSKCIWDFGDDRHTNNDDTANCTLYGRFYNFNSALEACPKGWHMPNNNEWNILINFLGGDSVAGAKLKSGEKEHWPFYYYENDNSFGFNAIATTKAGGQNVTNFWSYAPYKEKEPRIFELFEKFGVVHTQFWSKGWFACLRCLKD